MPAIRIDSIDDPRLAPYRDLPKSAGRNLSGRFIAEGRWLVERLLISDFDAESVLVDERHVAEVVTQVPTDIPIYVTARGIVDEIVGFNFHRGVLAAGKRPSTRRLDDALEALPAVITIAVCVDIQDAENLGGVLRNCAGFGVDLVLVSERCVDPFSRRVLRVSMGTAFKLTIVESTDIRRDLRLLRDANVELVATVLDQSADQLSAAEHSDRVALLFGNEAHGLDHATQQLCDRCLTVPMQRGTDSLNVATASGVFLYHFTTVAAAASAR